MSSSSAGQNNSSRFDLRLFAVLVVGFCVFLSVYSTQALLPELARVFGATPGHVGLTISATTLAVAVAAPFAGLLAERLGHKTVIVTAIFALALPTALAATAQSLNQLIAWRFAQGLVMPGIIAVTMAYISEEFPPSRVGAAMSAYIAGNVLGGVAGRLMSGAIGGHFGWEWAFPVLAALDLIGATIVLIGLPPSTHQKARPDIVASLHGMARHLRDPQVISSYFVAFNILLALVATFTYVTFHLANPPFNLGPVALGAMFLVYLVGVFVTPIGGYFIDQYGQRWTILIALVISGAGIAATLVPSLVMVTAGLALLSTGVFICQSAAASYMGAAAGKARGSAYGLYVTCYYAGGATGGFVPGLFWTRGGWFAVTAFVAVVLLLTVIVVVCVWKPKVKPKSTDHLEESLTAA